MARPSKFTESVTARIIAAVGNGNPYTVACVYGGVDYSTFRKWMIRGERAASGEYRTFFESIKRAENDAIMAHVASIEKSMKGSWLAAAWWLERRYPDEWGRRDRVDVRVLLEEEAARVADAEGLDKAQLLADAEAILRGRK